MFSRTSQQGRNSLTAKSVDRCITTILAAKVRWMPNLLIGNGMLRYETCSARPCLHRLRLTCAKDVSPQAPPHTNDWCSRQVGFLRRPTLKSGRSVGLSRRKACLGSANIQLAWRHGLAIEKWRARLRLIGGLWKVCCLIQRGREWANGAFLAAYRPSGYFARG